MFAGISRHSRRHSIQIMQLGNKAFVRVETTRKNKNRQTTVPVTFVIRVEATGKTVYGFPRVIGLTNRKKCKPNCFVLFRFICTIRERFCQILYRSTALTTYHTVYTYRCAARFIANGDAAEICRGFKYLRRFSQKLLKVRPPLSGIIFLVIYH